MTHPARPIVLLAVAGLGACASQPPIPMQMIDDRAIAYAGSLNPNDYSIEVRIGDRHYRGFYIIGTGSYVSTVNTVSARRFRSYETMGTYNSNGARAQLSTPNGEHITCEFLLDGRRVVGDCRASGGRIYQLVTPGR